MTKRIALCLLALLSLSFSAACQRSARENILWLLEKAGVDKAVEAPVGISNLDGGILLIQDTGLFLIQHTLADKSGAVEPNVILDERLAVNPRADKLMIVTHGWLEKGESDWLVETAAGICERVDPNEWVCGVYDWHGGSVVAISIQAAEYSRDVAGPRLAAAIQALPNQFKHIHLIGHSAGAWVLQSATKQLAAERPDTTFHLTFLDAYVPKRWDPQDLCDWGLENTEPNRVWAEHYYTRDYTLKMTQQTLSGAHNVDITALDPWVAEHEFPSRWYLATITGRYTRWDEKDLKVVTNGGGTEYGFARSREASPSNWHQSCALPRGGKPIEIKPGQ